MRPPSTAALLAALVIAVVPDRAPAQDGAAANTTDSTSAARSSWHIMVQGIPVLTHAQNTAEAADLTEANLSQAAVMGRANLLDGQVDPSAIEVHLQVLPEIGELQRRADRVGPGVEPRFVVAGNPQH